MQNQTSLPDGPRTLAEKIMRAADHDERMRLWKIAGSWGTVGFANVMAFVEKIEREQAAAS